MFKVKSVVKGYNLLSEMNKGAQGFVYLGEDIKTHEKFVVKSLFIEESKKKEFERMIEIWKAICSANKERLVVSYKEHFYDPETNSAVMVMEYCENGDLKTLIKKKVLEKEKIAEEEVIKALTEGMEGLIEMHSRNLIHRDIKSANMLIDGKGRYKMTDFNTSKILEGSVGVSTITGTLEYTAPEVVNSEEYSFEVDVFSLGAVVYEMMVGKTPFANERGVVLKNLTEGKYTPISAALGYSQSLVNVVHRCLSLDRFNRPTPTEVLALPFVVRMRDAKRMREAVVEAVQAERTERQKEIAELKRANEELRAKDTEQEAQIVRLMKANEELKAQIASVVAEIRNVPFVFLSSLKAEKIAVSGNKLRSSSTENFLFFVNKEMTSRIYKIVFVSEASLSSRQCGLALKTKISALFDQPALISGLCLISYSGISCGGKNCFNKEGLLPPRGKVTVGMELCLLDCNSSDQGKGGTLHFFVNGIQIPHVVTKIPPSVHFCFNTASDYGDFVGEVQSFQCLPTPTVNMTLHSDEYEWD